MLISRVYINQRMIDEIYIRNTGYKFANKYIYQVEDPLTGEKMLDQVIYHKRSDGYKKLLVQVLNALIEAEDDD